MLTGRIIKAVAGFYYVDVSGEGIFQCRAKGAFRRKGNSPLVGDIVDISLTQTQDVEGNVEEIHPRRSVLHRPTVANVDQALVVFALKDPDPSRILLDRILISLAKEELPAIICFNKSDITEDDAERELTQIYESCGYRVIVTSALKGEGVDTVCDALKGKLTTVCGPSGAGKSSLINCLQAHVVMETGAVSEKIGRGKQTTRHIQLVAVDENSYIIDTPGFGTIEPPDMKARELENFFPEMAEAIGGCRFRGCAHMDEPDCEVKRLVGEEKIAESRYKSYRTLYEELAEREKRY